MAERILAYARAKVNLSLEIVGSRSDGYHFIETVMQSLDLADELAFSIKEEPGVEIICDHPGVPKGYENLVVKAATRLISAAKMRGIKLEAPGVQVTIKKCIPVAAGLAGGSADAAATLLALNKLLRLQMTLQDLLEIGSGLGSDIPFCLTGGTVLVTGVGEKLAPLPPIPGAVFVLAIPDFGLSTKEVYEEYDRMNMTNGHPAGHTHSRDGPKSRIQSDWGTKGKMRAMIDALRNRHLAGIGENLYNALEPVAIRLRPQIGIILRILKDLEPLGVIMSGSGPTVFGLFPADATPGEQAWEAIRAHGWRIEIARPAASGVALRLTSGEF
ncbi:MAG TPA: 4-(cytidine 5'-diphospho)-2-C-methyl-D-erythritol kinase [Firmicutes bacterium]|nr:4-(cytidine 5'-diphospho)-2-C-methyl-D-erythritol kinase [Bacillota bacterium]